MISRTSNVAAQLSTTSDGKLKLAFANPSGQSNPVTIHARKTSATLAPTGYTDMFYDDIKTLYDLQEIRLLMTGGAPASRDEVGHIGRAGPEPCH